MPEGLDVGLLPLQGQFEKREEAYVKTFGHGRLTALAQAAFLAENARLLRQIDAFKPTLNMPFESWVTTVPQDRSWGVYFQEQYERVRQTVGRDCSGRGVELLDPSIGFPANPIVDEKSGPENLRKLAIAQKMINLLLAAKVEMIVHVIPQPAEDKGAIEYVPNPYYRPGAVSERERPREVPYLHPVMLREYPVEIAVVTRLKPLLEFLKSVRQGHQVLVIRSLNVMNRDVYEAETGGVIHLPKIAEQLKERDRLFVTISAAGMYFYAPEERQRFAPREQSARPRGPLPPDQILPAGH